jgi:hypothetical protein
MNLIIMPISFEKKLIFIHIPKTSGTFIENLFKMKHGLLTSGENCLLGRTKQHYPVKLILEILKENNINKDEYKFFTIIRNPYERFESVYNQYPGNKEFQEMINGRNKIEFADYLIDRINKEGYDFFNYGVYHQFQPMWMYLNDNTAKQININIDIYEMGTEKYISFIEGITKKYNIEFNMDMYKFNKYNISNKLKKKLDIIYEKDFSLFNE